MAKKTKSIHDCRCPGDFLKKAKKDPNAEIVSGGRHPYKVKGPKGSMPIATHGKNDEYGIGLRKAMQKQWVAIGLAPVLVILFIIGCL